MIQMSPNTQAYLAQAQIPLRLSAISPSGWPVVLSLWYVYMDQALYCATQKNARIVTYLQEEPRCGFEIAADLPPYCGVRGRARATLLPDRGAEILETLLVRYLGSTQNPLAQTLLARQEDEIAIQLAPLSISRWNFSNRMRESLPPELADLRKPCP